MRTLFFCGFLGVTACGASVVVDPGTDATPSDATTDTTSVDTGVTVIDSGFDARDICAVICASRPAKAKSDGWCEPFLASDAGFVGCAAYCRAREAAWTSLEKSAFVRCVESDPLCFRSIEDCMKAP